MSLLQSFNWVDLVIVVVFIRAFYTGTQAGCIPEFLKLLGAFLTLYVVLQYYSLVADFVGQQTSIPEKILIPASYVLLWLGMYLICRLIRDGILVVFSIETNSLVDKWGGVALSLGRFFIVSSMLLFLFLLTDVPYLEKATVKSLSHRYLVAVAPNIYDMVETGFVEKIFPVQHKNLAVDELLKKNKR